MTYHHYLVFSTVQAYQQYLDVKYTGSYLEEYGVEDELAANEEPFEASFTRLMDITRMITADEQQPQVRGGTWQGVGPWRQARTCVVVVGIGGAIGIEV